MDAVKVVGVRNPGMYIPGVCIRGALSKGLSLIDKEVPSQGVRGYELVIWGTAPASTDEVRAGYDGGEARGSVFTVEPSVANEVGADHSFGVVIVEVPVEAVCGAIDVRVTGPASETARIDPRPRLCDAAAS